MEVNRPHPLEDLKGGGGRQFKYKLASTRVSEARVAIEVVCRFLAEKHLNDGAPFTKIVGIS